MVNKGPIFQAETGDPEACEFCNIGTMRCVPLNDSVPMPGTLIMNIDTSHSVTKVACYLAV